jgi:MYXO-CTERM domain-containing protein
MRPLREARAIGRLAWLAGALALFAAGPPASAAPDAPPASIIGGTMTTVDQYPPVAGLVIGNNLCTGTLITPTWVMTAAHCVDPAVLGMASQDEVTRSVKVHFHTVDVLHVDGTVVDAIATFKDPLFDKAHLGTNDMGLIQLATPVTTILPSPLNLDAAAAPVGTRVTMVGYGFTAQGDQGSIGIQFVLKGRSSVACSSLGIGINTDANLLCFSQSDNKGTCQGDSGGPSFATIGGKLVVVAVTSFGDMGCATFGANTRVDIEQPFLATHVPDVIGCLTDNDCPLYRACFAHRCIAEPFGPNGIGTACTSAADCDSSVCAQSSRDGNRCSLTCSVSDDSSCPGGFECLRATGDVGACWPADGGCCDAGGAGGPTTMVAAIGLVAVVLRRKRR